ncbi:MAG: AMP-binding protein [Actinomycetota bacterium]
MGGIRLEPAEVEAALVEHPAISSAFVRTWTLTAPPIDEITRCVRCGLGDDVPGIKVDAAGVCTTCRAFDEVEPQTRRWFRSERDLDEQRERARSRRTGDIDALHLLSGGKDSTYALYQLVDRGWNVHAFTLDNGFISEGAKENIRRSVADLGITHEFAMPHSQDVMNEIFRDSLDRHSNVCQGCYKTIYTLGVARAREMGIPLVVTGLSRGQFFETRLVPHQFEEGHFDPDEIDATVLEARRVYHHTPDAVTELLPEQRVFDDADDVFEHVEFLDFYRYVDVELAELYRYLDERAPWVRPDDTGRSTNCLINVAGISTHRAERGFHNYAEPYAWDVRLGHKTRDEALDELDDEIDRDEVDDLLDAVGYEPSPPEVLTAWYTVDTSGPDADEVIDPDELRAFLRDRLPAHAVPSAFVRVDDMPLAASSKVDASALPAPTRFDRRSGERVEPATDTERRIAEIWATVLHVEHVGVIDDFFEIGGASLAALDVVARCDREFGTDLPDASVFRSRTVRELAEVVDAALASAGDEDSSTAAPASAPVVAIPARARRQADDPPPLSPGQEAMLLEIRSSGDDSRYNVTWSHRLRHDVDVVALEAAIRDVVDHHETLHTCFDPARTALAREHAVEWVDLGEVTDDHYVALADAERRRPFDLEAGPLVRCHVAATPARDTAAQGSLRLLVGIHHLAVDASSFDVFWDQVADRLAGRPLPDLPLTYGDVLGSSAPPSDRELAFWRGRAPDESGSRSSIEPPDVAEPDGYLARDASIDAAALRSAGSTPFVVSLTAAALTAATFRGEDRVDLGVPMSTRAGADAGDLIGYFLNTVPVELDVSGAATIRELIERASDEVAEVLAYRTTPLAAIVRDRRANRLPTPDTSFLLAHEVFRSGASSDDDRPGGHPLVDHEVLASGSAVADVTLFVQERADSVSIGIEYSGTSIGRDRAERMLDLFDTALEAAGRRPTTAPAVLRDSAAHRDLVGPPLRTTPTVLHQIVESMRTHPDSIAVVDQDGVERSAAQVAVDVSALAAQIDATIGGAVVMGRRRIGVALGRTAGLVESMLATWLVDGVYVPIDLGGPADRLASLVEIADLDLVIADLSGGDDQMPTALADVPVLDLGAMTESPAVRIDSSATYDWLERRADALDPSSTAYVIFTSGSTGRPRGVDVTHANLAASTSAREVFDDGVPPRYLVTPSPTFDSSMVGLVWPLTVGGTVVLAGDDVVGDVDRLGELIARSGVDHTLMVPSLHSALLRRRPELLGGLRRAVVAGEASSAASIAEHERLLPRVELVNEYGPTEATVWATWHRLDGAGLGATAETPSAPGVPIGSPIAGLTARVADDSGRPLPRGTTGELWVSGPTVTNGYLGDRSATSARFVDVDDRRWYRTGDLVVCRDDVLVFVGRVDDQLNVGGVRVEPAEIESAIAAVTGRSTDAVAVVAAGDPPQLVAHVESATPIDVGILRQALAPTLPAGAVPRRVVTHESLPRTGRGKLDRRRLEDWPLDDASQQRQPGAPPDGSDSSSTRSPAESLTPLGEAVLTEWRQVLDWTEVAADTDFFAAGGDSLTAVELVTALEERVGRPVAIATLLDAPSPRMMTEALTADGLWMPDTAHDDRGQLDAPSPEPAPGDDGVRVVTMRRGAGETSDPIVLMVPAWDDVFGYQALADAIGEVDGGRTDIVALAYTEVDGQAVVTRVDDLVDRFVARLADDPVTSSGRPLMVVGWSVGGVVAVELAERLAASGVPVVETVLVDTFFPGQHLHLWSNRWWKYKSMLRPDTLGEVVGEFTTMFRRRLQRYAKEIGKRLLTWSGTDLPAEPPRTSVGGFPVEALTHDPRVDLVPLFMVSASTTNPERTRNRWRELAPGLEYVVVPGRHRGFESVMGGDRVPAVADAIVERLAGHLDPASEPRTDDD